jgi:hypothetical protein
MTLRDITYRVCEARAAVEYPFLCNNREHLHDIAQSMTNLAFSDPEYRRQLFFNVYGFNPPRRTILAPSRVSGSSLAALAYFRF